MTSPFVVGAVVAVHYITTYTKDTVAKVYKNGNFTLTSNPSQQYRPNGSTARATGERFSSRRYVQIWDAKLDDFLAKRKAEQDHANLCYELKNMFSGAYNIRPDLAKLVATQIALDQISQ